MFHQSQFLNTHLHMTSSTALHQPYQRFIDDKKSEKWRLYSLTLTDILLLFQLSTENPINTKVLYVKIEWGSEFSVSESWHWGCWPDKCLYHLETRSREWKFIFLWASVWCTVGGMFSCYYCLFIVVVVFQ